MKPFATLGSEIGKVRERVRRGAESLRPSRVALDVREQRDRLLAKLGEQTFRLIAERKLVVPKVLQESVDRLAALLGVQLPAWPGEGAPDEGLIATPVARMPEPPPAPVIVEAHVEAASAPIVEDPVASTPAPPPVEAAPSEVPLAEALAEAPEAPAKPAKKSPKSAKATGSSEKSSPKGQKRATRRRK